ncbi:amidase family protein [Rhizobium azibense]|uniref:amidase family protein n=1 Tax=Rhizobium azibense TaxID=1136135 RepID=UPI0024799C98|nr:amidase family protein [Rhizobium azibense]
MAIRFPSATCGLTGLKPTWGRVSRPVFALADSLDHVGPMTRFAEDCAAILQAVAGWDASDPTSIDARPFQTIWPRSARVSAIWVSASIGATRSRGSTARSLTR